MVRSGMFHSTWGRTVATIGSVFLVLSITACRTVSDRIGDRSRTSGLTAVEIAGLTPEERLAAMSLRQKIGQRFIVYVPRGFGSTSSSGDDPTREYISLVKRSAPAGMIIYPWNFSDAAELRRLTAKLQNLSRYNLLGGQFLIAGDQEGGRVAVYRFRDLPRFPAAADVAEQAAQVPEYARYIESVAYITGSDLHSLGFNTNLAPVVDLSEGSRRTIIGDRSYGTDPETVGAYGVSYISGMMKSGVIPTVKHFPGHGVTNIDSHGRLPIVEITREDLWERDILPFRLAIEAGVPAVMTAHILFPAIDPSYPVTISETFLIDILRDDLGYEGVVVSDGLSMGALADNYEIDLVLERAIRLDVDLILIHDRYDFLQIVSRVEDLLDSGRIEVADIERGTLRVLRLKERFGLLNETGSEDEEQNR